MKPAFLSQKDALSGTGFCGQGNISRHEFRTVYTHMLGLNCKQSAARIATVHCGFFEYLQYQFIRVAFYLLQLVSLAAYKWISGL